MSDIVERLRDRDSIVIGGLFHAIPAMNQAADEIERLRQLVERLKTYAHHTSGCSYRYGHDCDCGVEELRRPLPSDHRGGEA